MIRMQGKGVVYGELWFDEPLEAPHPDILTCRQRSAPWPSGDSREFITLLVDLTQDEATLHAALRKDAQYEIRRASTKDNARYCYFDNPSEQIDAFCRFYDQFAVEKGLGNAHRAWLDQAAAVGRLVLTCVVHQEQPRVWHAYVSSGDRVRLLYSASLTQSADKTLRSLVGRLNRWLHWQDMLEFRRRGFRTYDLGGVFRDESSPAAIGINRFKEEFGGTQSVGFDCVTALSLRGAAYLKLLQIRKWVRKGRADQ